jgi:hypothetical protein
VVFRLACAWVLWSQSISPYTDVPDRWRAVAPFADEVACQRGLQTEVTQWRKVFTKQDLRGRVIDTTIVFEEEAKNPLGGLDTHVTGFIKYQCWPDTVDPRTR